jgi:hypothetical protein
MTPFWKENQLVPTQNNNNNNNNNNKASYKRRAHDLKTQDAS